MPNFTCNTSRTALRGLKQEKVRCIFGKARQLAFVFFLGLAVLWWLSGAIKRGTKGRSVSGGAAQLPLKEPQPAEEQARRQLMETHLMLAKMLAMPPMHTRHVYDLFRYTPRHLC
jgi:Zn-dependent protease with chaperone function